MPLLITEKDINWFETKEKVSSPPWLWECFLVSPINVSESHVILEEKRVSFELKKTVPRLWNNLEDQSKDDVTFCKQRREQAFEENKQRLEHIREENAKKKNEMHRSNVQKQMQIDDRERKRIEKEKQMENERLAAELERIRKEQKRADEIALKRKKMQEMAKELPPTRKSGHIAVTFTPRIFPTAARESQEAEEKEWLEKQAAAAVSLKLDIKDLSPQERNPEWLKRKAESLLKKGDHRGAVNAYSLAIRMCPNMHSLYLGRSTCHLHLKNLHKCIEDSSKALELLVPPVPSNANDRMQSHKIRGMAFHQLNLPVEGLMDLEAALKINPRDKELKMNAENLRKLIQSSED